MTQRIKAIVRYDGTGFSGWQIQPGETRSVQGTIEAALGLIARAPVRIHGAGRTDAGVHALGQVFHCEWNGTRGLGALRRSLSQMLSPEIRIETIEAVPDDFHARFSAISKRYAYVFSPDLESDPFSARYVWRLPYAVEPEAVHAMAQRLVGCHDFAGFRASGSSVKDTVRTIHRIELHRGPIVGAVDESTHWRLEFHGTGFLYKMIRNLTGTIVDVVRGAAPEERIDELLESTGPYRGFCAPACGLFLVGVGYD